METEADLYNQVDNFVNGVVLSYKPAKKTKKRKRTSETRVEPASGAAPISDPQSTDKTVKRGPRKTHGSCKYFNDIDLVKGHRTKHDEELPIHTSAMRGGVMCPDYKDRFGESVISKQIDQLVDEAMDAEVASFEKMTDVMLDMRKFIERARKIDVADDKLLQQAISDATALVREIEQGGVKDRSQIADRIQAIVNSMKDSNVVDHEDDDMYRNIAKKYNLNL